MGTLRNDRRSPVRDLWTALHNLQAAPGRPWTSVHRRPNSSGARWTFVQHLEVGETESVGGVHTPPIGESEGVWCSDTSAIGDPWRGAGVNIPAIACCRRLTRSNSGRRRDLGEGASLHALHIVESRQAQIFTLHAIADRQRFLSAQVSSIVSRGPGRIWNTR